MASASSLFCNICNNLVSVITTSEDFYFKCSNCQQAFKPSENDTLRYEQVKGTNLLIYKTLLQNAGRDPVNPKVRKDCTCGNDIVKQVRLGDDMKLLNVCTKCSRSWLEGIE